MKADREKVKVGFCSRPHASLAFVLNRLFFSLYHSFLAIKLSSLRTWQHVLWVQRKALWGDAAGQWLLLWCGWERK
jgi:hypothetical protein